MQLCELSVSNTLIGVEGAEGTGVPIQLVG